MAYHEAGHTIIGMVLDDAEVVHKVTIVPRGQAGGYAVMLPREDRYFMTKPELLDKIVGLLAGRVAEEITFGEVSTGAHNDFERSTAIARSMVTEYGMSDRIGPIQFTESNHNVFLGKEMGSGNKYSDKIAYEIDQEIQEIVKRQYDRCREILLEHQDQLNLIAETLLVEETLDREQIEALFTDGVLPERVYEVDEEEKDVDAAGKSYEDVKKELHEDEPADGEEEPSDGEVETETTNLPDEASHEPKEIDQPVNPKNKRDLD